VTDAAFGADWSASLRRGSDEELRGWVDAALAWCDETDAIALEHFRREVGLRRKPDRTFVTLADTTIAMYDAKYTFQFWRPITAIRNADQTGNPATPREAGWLPLGETPMHPEYPCAHCISAAAVAAVLRGVLGDDIAPVTMTSVTAPGISRRFTRLTDYEEEVSNARVWAGFHYRFSTVVGRDMGRKIGERALATQLKPRH